RVVPSLVLLDGEDDRSRSPESDCCPVLRLGVRSLGRARALSGAFKFVRFLCRQRIDILQAYFLDSVYFGVPLARLAGVRRVIRVRNNLGYWLTLKHRFLARIYGKFIDQTLTNSQQSRNTLIADGGTPAHTAVIEHGVD